MQIGDIVEVDGVEQEVIFVSERVVATKPLNTDEQTDQEL